MKIEGQLKPPAMGIGVEPYPMSGRGALEVTSDALVIEGSKGYPIEVTLLGFLGFVLASIASYVGYANLGMRSSLLAFYVVFIGGGTALGYKLAHRRDRARHTETVPAIQVIDAMRDGDEVQVTVQIKRRWQKRKQIVHFYPTDPTQSADFLTALYAMRKSANQGPVRAA